MKATDSWEVYSTDFGFNGSLAMVSYVSKKLMVVVALSTMYHSKMVAGNTRKVKKIQLFTFYNKTKGDVDTVDQKVGTHCTPASVKDRGGPWWCGTT